MQFIVFFIFWLFLIGCLLSVVWWSLRNGISPMPTSPKVKRRLLEILPQQVRGPVFELGSGWGSLALSLARHYPLLPVTGYETSPLPFYVSRLRAWMAQLPGLRLCRADFFAQPLGEAALVVCYLYPGAMLKLKSKFQHELQPGTWVISHTFAIPGWQPQAVYEVEDLYRTKIYVYLVSRH